MDAKVNGNLTVADDVLADLVAYAAKECYGVVAMASPASATVQEGLAGLLSSTRRRRGITIEHDEDGRLTVTLNVILEYGVNISAVSQNLVDGVQFALRNVAQIDDAEVLVRVESMKVRES